MSIRWRNLNNERPGHKELCAIRLRDGGVMEYVTYKQQTMYFHYGGYYKSSDAVSGWLPQDEYQKQIAEEKRGTRQST